jgi:peptidoglycan/xylan/chitin deacetylase (PgdA/CDA1 family)
MSRRSTKLLKAALSALHYTGADDLAAPFLGGKGVVFMLHHVVPDAPREFEPNGILKITPEFLETVIRLVLDSGFECISMDEVADRIKGGAGQKPFAAFTLDDGYKDNRDHAFPVFKKFGVPFTIYVPTDFAEGRGDLWWLTLEEALRSLPAVTLEMNGTRRTFSLDKASEKDVAFQEIYWWLRQMPEDRARAVTHRLAREARFDHTELCSRLVTIGAHTKTHFALAKLSDANARREITDSVARITAEFGKPCLHFSYPYGCELSAGEREFAIAEELGLATAVTTRKGLLHESHKDSMTALPRLSLNGDFQDVRYIKVLLSGAPFALWNAARRLKPSGTMRTATGN